MDNQIIKCNAKLTYCYGISSPSSEEECYHVDGEQWARQKVRDTLTSTLQLWYFDINNNILFYDNMSGEGTQSVISPRNASLYF